MIHSNPLDKNFQNFFYSQQYYHEPYYDARFYNESDYDAQYYQEFNESHIYAYDGYSNLQLFLNWVNAL